jgi:hypothetical protein
MAQGAPGAEQLPFGVLALDFHGERFGHWPWVAALRFSTIAESRKN